MDERPEPFGSIQRRYDVRLRRIVAVLHPGDYYVADAGELISTVLGSCVSACVRDRRLGFGGMNHFMLPSNETQSVGAWTSNAWVATRFGNVAMEYLINALMRRGGRRDCLELKLVGGGKVIDALTDIGARNIQFVHEYVRAEGFHVLGEDLGDIYPRKVIYDPSTGAVRVKRLPRTSRHLVADEVRYLRDINGAPPGGAIELF